MRSKINKSLVDGNSQGQTSASMGIRPPVNRFLSAG